MEKIPVEESSRPSMDTDAETNEKIGESPKDVAQQEPAAGEAVTEDDWEYVTGVKLYTLLALMTLACFIMLLDTSIIVTAIPVITSDFHSLSDVGWYGSAYLLTCTCLQPLSGKMYAEWSTKWTFVCFVCVFELGSLLCGIAQNSNMLIIGRAVAGLGASGILNGALTAMTDCVPVHAQATIMGVMISVAQLGILAGPLLGGAFTEYATWRWCFFINLPLGAISVGFLILVKIPDRSAKNRLPGVFFATLKKLDLIGFSIFAPAMVMCLLALEWGGVSYPWNSATVIGLFCGSAALLVVFGVWEYRQGDSAMIPFSVLRQRAVFSCMISMFGFMGHLLLTTYYLPIFFQAVNGVSPLLSGVYLLPNILVQMLFTVITGIGIGIIGYYVPFSLASGIISAIALGLYSTLTHNSSTAMWVGFQIVGGASRGLGISAPMVAISSNVKKSQVSIGMALLTFGQSFGGAFWLAVGQTVFNSGLKTSLAEYAPEVSAEAVSRAGAAGIRDYFPEASIPGIIKSYEVGISHVFYIGAGCGVIVFCAAWGLRWTNVKKKKEVKTDVVPPTVAEV